MWLLLWYFTGDTPCPAAVKQQRIEYLAQISNSPDYAGVQCKNNKERIILTIRQSILTSSNNKQSLSEKSYHQPFICIDNICSYPIEIMISILFIDSNLCLRYIYKPDLQPRQIKPSSFPVSLSISWTSYYV